MKAIGMAIPSMGLLHNHVNASIVANEETQERAWGDEAQKFTSFESWMKLFGKDYINQRSRYIDGFDADIISLHCPIATKVRMQRARNYDRLLEERKRWFKNSLNFNGVVQWWP